MIPNDIFANSVERLVDTKIEMVDEKEMEEGLISGEEIFEAKVQNMSTETAAKKLEYTWVRFYRVVWKSQWVKEALLQRFCGMLIDDFWKTKNYNNGISKSACGGDVVADETQKIRYASEGAPQPSEVSSSSNTNNETTKTSENDDNEFITIGDDASVQQIAETKRNLLLGSLGDHTYLKQSMLNNRSNMPQFLLVNKTKTPRQLIENSDDLLNYIHLIARNNFLVPTKRTKKRKNLKLNKKGVTKSVSRETNTGKQQKSSTLQISDIEKESNLIDGVEIKSKDENSKESEDEYAFFEESTSSDEDRDYFDPKDEDFKPSDESFDENDFHVTSSDEDNKTQPPRKKKTKPREPPKPRKFAGPMLKCQECGKNHMEQPCPRCPKLKTCEVCGYRYVFKCIKCACKCKFCGRACMNSSRLKEHIDAMHKRLEKYKCHLCEKRFRHKNVLLVHIEKHKEVADMICDVCGKAFKHKKNLSRHLRIHSDVRYKCEVCGREFVEKDVLKTHSLLHTTGPKRFKCGVCAKDFHHKVSLKEHIGRHHKDADQVELLIDTWKKDPERLGEVTENESDEESEDRSDEEQKENGQQKESMVSSSLAAATAALLLYDNQSSSTDSLRSDSVHNRKQSEESIIKDLLHITQQDIAECDSK